MDPYDCRLNIDEVICGKQVMFAAKSYLADRIVPAIEEIILPAVNLPGGSISYDLSGIRAVSASRDAKRITRLMSKYMGRRFFLDIPGIVIDFRLQFPGNWAHSLNSHLPLALFLRGKISEMSSDEKISILLDADIPEYILNLFALFGFDTIKCSSEVEARFIAFDASPWSCLRSVSRRFVENYFFGTNLYSRLLLDATVPEKVFLSRKTTRKLSNERDVESFLNHRGFVTVYPEDLSVSAQLQIFMKASRIVAVHGAGMGPLLYRSATLESLGLVELLSPGHMTNYYRTMANQTGAKWVGVRGRIERCHVPGAYTFDRRYVKHSLKPFHVDIESLDAALNYLDSGARRAMPAAGVVEKVVEAGI